MYTQCNEDMYVKSWMAFISATRRGPLISDVLDKIFEPVTMLKGAQVEFPLDLLKDEEL
jgi:hypothetical protein